MINTSMLEFARCGTLGPLRCGLTQDEMLDLLGAPPMWGPQKTWNRARIWRYGDVEFCLEEWIVTMIFSDHERLTDGGPTLEIEPWVVRPGSDPIEFQEALRRANVEFTAELRYEGSHLVVTTTAGAAFCFLMHDDDDDAIGLFAWHSSV